MFVKITVYIWHRYGYNENNAGINSSSIKRVQIISTYTPSIPHLSNEELQEKINDALQGLLYYQLIEKWQVEVLIWRSLKKHIHYPITVISS